MTKAVLVRLPEKLLEDIDKLVTDGYYSSRSDLIRMATRMLAGAKIMGFKNMTEYEAWGREKFAEESRKMKQDYWDELCKKAGTTDEEKVGRLLMKELKKVKMP